MARSKRRVRFDFFPYVKSDSKDFVGQTGSLDDQCIAITATGQRCSKNASVEGPHGPVCGTHWCANKQKKSTYASKTIRPISYYVSRF